VLLVGDVGDVGARNRDIAAGDAIQQARGEQQSQRIGQAEQQEGQRRAQDAEQQDRAATEAIRHAPQQRRANELRRRIGRHQQPGDGVAGAVPLGIKRQQRQDQPESQHIDENDGQKDRQAAFVHGFPYVCVPSLWSMAAGADTR